MGDTERGASGVADEITVAELALRRGLHIATIRRWLLSLDAKHGGGVVWRRGGKGKLFTSAAALARVAPDLAEPDRDLRAAIADLRKDNAMLTNRTTTLLSRLRELTARVEALEPNCAKLRKTAHAGPRVRDLDAGNERTGA